MAEEKLMADPERKQYAELFVESCNVYHSTSHSVIALSKRFKELRPEPKSFNITQLLKFIIELHVINALANNNSVELFIESSFPKEVTGEKAKFELVLDFIANHFTEHMKDNQLKIAAKLKSFGPQGFCLLFEFECRASGDLAQEKLAEVFITEDVDPNRYETPLKNLQVKELLSWLKARVRVSQEDERVCLQTEVLFGTQDQSLELVKIPTIRMLPKEQVNNYVTRWSNDISENADELKSPEAPSRILYSPQVDDAKAKELVQEKLKQLRQSEDEKKLKINQEFKLLKESSLLREDQKAPLTFVEDHKLHNSGTNTVAPLMTHDSDPQKAERQKLPVQLQPADS